MAKDMLTVPRDLLQDLTDDVADYAVSRTFKDRETTWRSDLFDRARAILARQPAAIDKEAIRSLIADDAYAMSFQSMGQYRSALLKTIAAPLPTEASKPAPSVEQDELLLAAKEVLANGHQHDVGGGDVFVGTCEAAERLQRAVDARAASTSANVAQGANLDVWYGPMPESNGKTNWTAILHKGDLAEGHTIDRSEYPDRVRYAADCVRYLIGELKERPWILDYDADKHSGYVANVAQGAEAVGFEWPALPDLPVPIKTELKGPSFKYAQCIPYFSDHQMQGYANAYGEAVRAALAAAQSASGDSYADKA